MTQDVVVYVVDDDECARNLMRLLLMTVGLEAAIYDSSTAFIEQFDPHRPGCVVLDLRMPELNGIETLIHLRERSKAVPVIFVTGHGDLPAAVRAMKLGAVDFFEKPADNELLLESIQRSIRCDIEAHQALHRREVVLARIAKLTSRERQVLDCVLNGMSNKETARHLGVGPKAIEIYRGHLMQKMEVDSVVTLIIEILGCCKMVAHPDARPPCLFGIDHGSIIHSARHPPPHPLRGLNGSHPSLNIRE